MADAYRVVVVEDDADVAFYTKTVLQKRGGCEVVTVSDPSLARAVIADFRPDIVVTDIEMPGLNGLELMAQIREDQPGLPVVVMTAHISVDYAVGALNGQADEFLIKPISASDLVAAVMRLAAEGRARREGSGSITSVLAIGVHPDEVEVGIGGILAGHRAAGDTITIVTLTRSNDGVEQAGVQDETLAAAELLGARLFLEDITEADLVGSATVAAVVARIVGEITPNVIYVPSAHDYSPANLTVHEAVLAAAPAGAAILAYQGPTSNSEFRPTEFVSIDATVDEKLALLKSFDSHIDSRSYLDPELVVATARYWGRFGDGVNVEPLEIVREATDAGEPDQGEPAAARSSLDE